MPDLVCAICQNCKKETEMTIMRYLDHRICIECDKRMERESKLEDCFIDGAFPEEGDEEERFLILMFGEWHVVMRDGSAFCCYGGQWWDEKYRQHIEKHLPLPSPNKQEGE